MLRGILSVSLAALLATSASAAPPTARKVPANAFYSYCGQRAAQATCQCVEAELQQTMEGQIALEAIVLRQRYSGGELPNGEVLSLLNRYGLKASEMRPLLDDAKGLTQSVIDRCK